MTTPTFTLRTLHADMSVKSVTGFPHFKPCDELARFMPIDGITDGRSIIASQVWHGDALLRQYLTPEIDGVIDDFLVLQAACSPN